MSQILSKKYSLLDNEPSKLVMTQIDEMFRDLFTGLRNSAIGGTSSGELALDPTSFVSGDILYLPDSTGTVDGLTIASNAGTFLRSDGLLPEWSTLVLPNAATTGDLLYANATDTIARLADIATGNALISGGVGVAPVWSKIGLTTHISGTLGVGNGGTGKTTFTLNGVLYGNTTSLLQVTAQGAARTVLIANAGAPSFSADPTVESVTAFQQTLGNAVLQLKSLATNDDPTVTTYQNRVATTDATVTTLHTVTIPATTTVLLTGSVVARRTGGVAGTAEDGAAYTITAVYKNVAGTATSIGGSVTTVGEDQVAWDVTLTPSSGTVLIQVTGAVDNNLTWHGTFNVIPVGS